jgi:hypothetical protein
MGGVMFGACGHNRDLFIYLKDMVFEMIVVGRLVDVKLG